MFVYLSNISTEKKNVQPSYKNQVRKTLQQSNKMNQQEHNIFSVKSYSNTVYQLAFTRERERILCEIHDEFISANILFLNIKSIFHFCFSSNQCYNDAPMEYYTPSKLI